MALFDEYKMLTQLGRGAYATVYKVRHNQLGYTRAIRVLNEIVVDPNDETYQKFLHECTILLRLGNGCHNNIVRIYQPRLIQNHALVEMDYINGDDIEKYLKKNNRFLPVSEVIRCLNDIGGALAYCHHDIFQHCYDREIDDLEDDPDDGSKVLLSQPVIERLVQKYKVIHNDIHSHNIIRRHDGSYVLLDFGLAIQEGSNIRRSQREGGAPEYKPPEKWESDGGSDFLSESSDIYSMGVVLYEMLTSQTPFPYDTRSSREAAEYNLGRQHLTHDPPAIEPLRKKAFEALHPNETYKKDYPHWLEQLIFRCLAKKPEDRFANGKELYNEYLKQQRVENDKVINKGTVEKQSQLDDVLKLCEKLQIQIGSKNSVIAKQSEKIEKINLEADSQLKALQKEIEDLRNQKESASAAFGKLVASLQKEKAELTAKIEQTNEKANKQIESLNAEKELLLQQAGITNGSLTEQINTLQTENTGLQLQLDNANNVLGKQIKELINEKAILRQEMEKIEKNSAKLIEDLQSQNEDLQLQVKTLKDEASARFQQVQDVLKQIYGTSP